MSERDRSLELLLVEVAEALRQIAGVDCDIDHAVERAARNDQLAAGRAGRVGDRFDARDVRGKGRHRHAVLARP